MVKKGEGILSGDESWQVRKTTLSFAIRITDSPQIMWCILKDDTFYFYETSQDFCPRGQIALAKCWVEAVADDVAERDALRPFSFQLGTPQRTLIFSCDDDEELEGWMGDLQSALEMDKREKYKSFYIPRGIPAL